MEPTTGVLNQPIRHGTLTGMVTPGFFACTSASVTVAGTVIEQRTILTAAHCVDNAAAASDVYVVLEDGYRQASATVSTRTTPQTHLISDASAAASTDSVAQTLRFSLR